MAVRSAGILLYRRRRTGAEILLVHPGGPFWSRRDLGSWSIPKGEFGADEEAEAAARREFAEETGCQVSGPLLPLGEARQKAGKLVTAFAAEGEVDPSAIRSNSFEIEWPPRSGRRRSFPEIDRAEWFDLAAGRTRILPGQLPFIDRLEAILAGG